MTDADRIADDVRTLVREELAPVAREFDRDGTYPEPVLDALADAGVTGITLPESHDGLGLGLPAVAAVTEELAAELVAVASVLSVHWTAAELVERFATGSVRERYLADMARFDAVGALGVTEANAGNDKSGVETTARPEGDEWVLDGRKRWVTNFPEADLVALYARAPAGVTGFVVPADDLTLAKRWDTLGVRSVDVCAVDVDDVRVPESHVLGDVGRGNEQRGTVDVGAVNYAARGVGVARAALADAVDYLEGREQFGRPIADFQGVRFQFADMATRTEAARLLTRRAAERADAGADDAGVALSMAKLRATEAAVENATQSVRLHGGVGFTAERDVERYLRDAQLLTIGGGASELQRAAVADALEDGWRPVPNS